MIHIDGGDDGNDGDDGVIICDKFRVYKHFSLFSLGTWNWDQGMEGYLFKLDIK